MNNDFWNPDPKDLEQIEKLICTAVSNAASDAVDMFLSNLRLSVFLNQEDGFRPHVCVDGGRDMDTLWTSVDLQKVLNEMADSFDTSKKEQYQTSFGLNLDELVKALRTAASLIPAPAPR